MGRVDGVGGVFSERRRQVTHDLHNNPAATFFFFRSFSLRQVALSLVIRRDSAWRPVQPSALEVSVTHRLHHRSFRFGQHLEEEKEGGGGESESVLSAASTPPSHTKNKNLQESRGMI